MPDNNERWQVSDLPHAYPSLNLSAAFRSYPEDFVVQEQLGFTPTDSGEHWLLSVEKTGQNTHWVAEQLARFCQLPASAVGYCGRKDRHAITQQWFSLYAPKQTHLDWQQLTIEGVKLLAVHRHSKKLRLGSHEANQFSIRLRNVTQSGEALSEAQQQALSTDIQLRLEQGVPNYFGEQRFGREQSNLVAAAEWFGEQRKPHPKRRSMIMSAARSYLFNLVLAERIRQENWQTLLAGDVVDDTCPGKPFPTGPLWGRGRSPVTDISQELENLALAEMAEWCGGLEYCGLQQERRSLVLLPQQPSLRWLEQDLVLSFSLPVGAFATAVLAEVSDLGPVNRP